MLTSTGSLLGSNSEVSLHRLDVSAMECLGNCILQVKMSFKCASVFPKQSLEKTPAEGEMFNQVLDFLSVSLPTNNLQAIILKEN